jgi:hypothetical protein
MIFNGDLGRRRNEGTVNEFTLSVLQSSQFLDQNWNWASSRHKSDFADGLWIYSFN